VVGPKADIRADGARRILGRRIAEPVAVVAEIRRNRLMIERNVPGFVVSLPDGSAA